MLVDQHK
jgi:hypothetical protein